VQNPHQPASIHFNIGRITLHGYTTANQRSFTNSLQRSLGELVEARRDYDWSNATSLRIRKMSGGKLNPGASPEEAAMQVARQIVQQALQLRGGRHDG
jgi:hypothetical protein